MVNDNLPKLTQDELQRIQILHLQRELCNSQIESFIAQLMLKYKIDPEKYYFDLMQGRFVEKQNSSVVQKLGG